MKRRNLLAAIGVTAAGSAAVGTGAFTSVEADRTVNVTIADEDEALLALEPTDDPNSEIARPSTSKRNRLVLDFDDSVGDGSRGPGTNSVYNFDRIFEIRNQGTQPTFLRSEFPETADIESVEFYVEESDEYPIDGKEAVAKIGAGDSAKIGVTMDTDGIDVERGEGNTDINNFTAEITAEDEPPEDVSIVSTDGDVHDNGNGGGG